MIRTQRTLAALVMGVMASVLCAQQADKNTAGPTKNDYRLRVVEPREGSIVTGSSLQVTVDTRVPPEVGGDRKDSNSMPTPRVSIYIDNEVKGTLTDTQNTITIDNVVPGDHKLVVVAMNKSNEIIDRKVVSFSMTAAASSASSSSAAPSTSAYSAAPPPASSSSPVYSAPPSAPSAPASAIADEQPSSTLPKTGTSNTLALGAGLALVAGGLVLRRRSR
jgi:LPXTG-motif cell wall-anchored protein